MPLKLKPASENPNVAKERELLNRISKEINASSAEVVRCRDAVIALDNAPRAGSIEMATAILDGNETKRTERRELMDQRAAAERRIEHLQRAQPEQAQRCEAALGDATYKAAREAWPEFERAARKVQEQANSLLAAAAEYDVLRQQFDNLGYNVSLIPTHDVTGSVAERLKGMLSSMLKDAEDRTLTRPAKAA